MYFGRNPNEQIEDEIILDLAMGFGAIKRKIASHYSNQTKEGYRWYTNCELDRVEQIKREQENTGLEVFVGQTTFDIHGKIRPDYCAILVREKKKSQ